MGLRHVNCCNVCMLVNKRLDDWIPVDLMDLSKLEPPKKENKTPMKVMNGSRPSSPDREMVHFCMDSWTHALLVEHYLYLLPYTYFHFNIYFASKTGLAVTVHFLFLSLFRKRTFADKCLHVCYSGNCMHADKQ